MAFDVAGLGFKVKLFDAMLDGKTHIVHTSLTNLSP